MILQCFLEILPYDSSEIIRIQNYEASDLVFQGDTYEFAGFEFRSYPEQRLELGNEQAEIFISNNEITAGLLRDFDGFRRATIKAYHYSPDSDLPLLTWILECLYAEPVDAYIKFLLKSPTGALTGPLISRYFNAVDFPALPQYRLQL